MIAGVLDWVLQMDAPCHLQEVNWSACTSNPNLQCEMEVKRIIFFKTREKKTVSYHVFAEHRTQPYN